MRNGIVFTITLRNLSAAMYLWRCHRGTVREVQGLPAQMQTNQSSNAYISRNSAAGYYSTFRALLKIAYKEKMLRENLNDFLEKIEWKEVKKEYLTLDEVKKLALRHARFQS